MSRQSRELSDRRRDSVASACASTSRGEAGALRASAAPMNALVLLLVGDAALLALSVAAVVAARRPAAATSSTAPRWRYASRCCPCSRRWLRCRRSPAERVIRCRWSCPGLARHFRLDPLAAGVSSWLAVSECRGEPVWSSATGVTSMSRSRVLPFYPAFLAALSLVVLVDDAFTFLVALGVDVPGLMGAGDGAPQGTRQHPGRLRLSRHGQLRRIGPAVGLRPAGRSPGTRLRDDPGGTWRTTALAAPSLVLALIGAGSKAGPGRRCMSGCRSPIPAAPSHVSALMSGVMTRSRSTASSASPSTCWARRLVVERRRCSSLGGVTAVRRPAVRVDGARPETAARLQHGREHRHHLHRPWPGPRVRGQRPAGRARPWR